MFKFAHIADAHLGANRHPALEPIETTIFNQVMDKCIEEKVDFILICGDLFHIGIPDLGVVNNCVKKLKEVSDNKIPVYVIFGSHDYNPTTDSIIDILDSSGLIKNIVVGTETDDGKIKLDFTVDEKTGAKITGIHARKGGVEKTYYENLERESLEIEPGFKIFCLHTGLSEFKPTQIAAMETIPVSYLPKNFAYYAGGHIHKRIEASLPDFKHIVYPGPIFSAGSQDLEMTAKGEKRGFYIVSFDKKVTDMKFVEIEPCIFVFKEFNVDGKNSIQANQFLESQLQNLEVCEKIVLIKIKGELSGGKTSDVKATNYKNILIDNGALFVDINRYSLSSKEFNTVKVQGEDIPEIEKKLLRENIGAIRLSLEKLKGDKGSALAEKLLMIFRIESKEGELKRDYNSRIFEEGVRYLGIEEIFK
jgi:exonuclease SbcD